MARMCLYRECNGTAREQWIPGALLPNYRAPGNEANCPTTLHISGFHKVVRPCARSLSQWDAGTVKLEPLMPAGDKTGACYQQVAVQVDTVFCNG